MTDSHELAFRTFDVFTDERFAGNPLAVVDGADGLSHEQMRAVAKEFNLPETVFVMAPANPAHSARVRIFTPDRELPFAGHPTVGTAVRLALLQGGDGAVTSERQALVVMEQDVGLVRVGVKLHPDGVHFAEFDLPKLPEKLDRDLSVEALARALGVADKAMKFENHRPSAWSAGVPFVFVPMRDLGTVADARPQADAFRKAVPRDPYVGVYLYSRECVHTTSDFHARMFAPESGILEDPATGSAAAAFAGVIAEFDALRDGVHRRVIEQGYEMGRPSQIEVEIEIENRAITNVRIGGKAIAVSRGHLAI